jgi:hypothetical protein
VPSTNFANRALEYIASLFLQIQVWLSGDPMFKISAQH